MRTVDAEAPLITVVRGRPTAAELAAVVATLFTAGRAAAGPEAGMAPPTAWAELARSLHLPPRPGPRAWRNSAQPR